MLGLLNRLWDGITSPRLSTPAVPSPLDDFWYHPVGRQTGAGVDVDENSALTYSACWAATRLLAGTGGWLPLNLYRRLPGGGKEIASDHPLHTILHDAPNREMTSMMFRCRGINQQVNQGNTYAEIVRNPLGKVAALWPIHSSRVTPCRDAAGNLIYEVKVGTNAKPIHLDAADVLHVPAMVSKDGISGIGVVDNARESIGLGMAQVRHGATFFGNGARPGIVVTHPNKLSPEARSNFRREWAEIHEGPQNAHKMALLQEGADIKPFGFNMEQAQFIEGNQWSIEDVARWYGVPPHMIQHLLRATFNNIEQMGIDFVTYSLMPWLCLWEQECNRKLLTAEERKVYFVKFNVDALMRGDMASRTAASVQQVFNGLLTLNQWAEREDMNPIGPLGDLHFVQSAMVPLEIAAKGPQEPGAAVEAEPDADDSADADKLLDVPDRRQSTDYSCGAAATWSVADYLGVGEGRVEDDYIRELPSTPEDGTEPEAIIDWFTDHGCVVTSGPGMTIEDLRLFCAAGQPIIVPVQMYGMTAEYDAEEIGNETGHYVVVIGVGMGHVFYQDPAVENATADDVGVPSGGRGMMTVAEFDRRWHDVEAPEPGAPMGVVDDHFGIAVRRGVGAPLKPVASAPLPVVQDEETPPTGEPAATGEVVPVETHEAAAGVADVQQTALNGAQIASLLQIVNAVAQKQLPPETGKASLRASFPLMSEELIGQIIDPLKGFEPPEPPEPPEPDVPPPSPPSDEPPGPEGDEAGLSSEDAVRQIVSEAFAKHGATEGEA